MKVVLSFLILLGIASLGAVTPAEAATAELPGIPTSVEEFVALRDKLATTPEGGAATLVAAMIIYGQNKELGMQCFTVVLDQSYLGSGSVYKGYAPTFAERYIKEIDTRPYLGRVYVQGTTSADAYQLPGAKPFRIDCPTVKADAETATVFVATTSGNTPRPIKLKKNDKGIWKGSQVDSLFVGVSKVPAVQKKDDL